MNLYKIKTKYFNKNKTKKLRNRKLKNRKLKNRKLKKEN